MDSGLLEVGIVELFVDVLVVLKIVMDSGLMEADLFGKVVDLFLVD